jgi:peptidoglycan/xylan/chitin deacetylase (PgdA/CDA1 family)
LGAQGGRAAARALLQRSVKLAASSADRVRRPASGVVALLYHRVGATSGAREIDVPVALFDDQMAVLRERTRVVRIDRALDELAGATPADAASRAVVTFDDGTADFVDVALPVLDRHRVPVVLYVATAFVEEGREFPGGGRPVSWAALRDAIGTGLVTIGSHTHTHRLLDRLPAQEVDIELDRSRKLIEDRLGVAAKHFAYPKAVAPSAAAAAAVRARFRSAAVAGTRPNRYGATDPYRLARSPVQTSDGMRWFRHKLAGGMRLEDDVRRLANRLRYAGASS